MDYNTELEYPKIHSLSSRAEQNLMQFPAKDDPPDIITENDGIVHYICVDQILHGDKETENVLDNSKFYTAQNSGLECDPLGCFSNEEEITDSIHKNNIKKEDIIIEEKSMLDKSLANMGTISNECIFSKTDVCIFDIDNADHKMMPLFNNATLKITDLSYGDSVSTKYGRGKKAFVTGKKLSRQTTLYLHSRENPQQSGMRIYVCDCGTVKDHQIENPDKMPFFLNDPHKYSNSDHIKTEYFNCRFCNKIYSVVNGLRYHIIEQFTKIKTYINKCIRKNKRYVCEVCDIVFEKQYGLTEHNRENCKARKYICERCYKNFLSFADLKKHNEDKHKAMKKFKCGECLKTYSSLFFLKHHINAVHSKLRNYVCEKCGKMFLSIFVLKKHVNGMHSGVKYKCQECQKIYSTFQRLQKHKDTVHEGTIKLVKCDVCNKMFSSSSHRKRHIDTVHKGIKRYKCPSCDRTFTQRSNMNIHISGVHYHIKKYECELCLRTFLHLRDLKLHINAVHNGIKDYICLECKKKYFCKTHLKQHIESVHIHI